jgi:hypothetical protein
MAKVEAASSRPEYAPPGTAEAAEPSQGTIDSTVLPPFRVPTHPAPAHSTDMRVATSAGKLASKGSSRPRQTQNASKRCSAGQGTVPSNGRWNKRRLSPKDPAEAAKNVQKEIDALLAHLEMKAEVKRQEEAFKNAARTIKNLLRIEDNSFNAMILAGAGGTGKTRLVKQTLFECALQRGDQQSIRVAWLDHHKVTTTQLLNDLYAYRHKANVIVFDDMDRIFDDFEMVEILNGALERERAEDHRR